MNPVFGDFEIFSKNPEKSRKSFSRHFNNIAKFHSKQHCFIADVIGHICSVVVSISSH